MTAFNGILVLIGPTASGKSAVALALAEKIGGEILTVDSMQVYRGMEIGTAKPTPAEQSQVKHHLLDLLDPNEGFAVSKFVESADAVIADAAARNVPLIATGGTPMYYKALFEGLFDGPGADSAVRETLAANTNEVLHAKLSQVDPPAAQRIHLNDRRRLIRALEVFEITGKSISSMQNEWQGRMQRHPAKWFGLQWDREELNRRINSRVREMMAVGWLDEVKRLIEQFGDLSKTAAEATGYHELIEHLRGRMPLNDAVEQIKIATRQLARRQMKWFRRFPDVKWIPGNQPVENSVAEILDTNAPAN